MSGVKKSRDGSKIVVIIFLIFMFGPSLINIIGSFSKSNNVNTTADGFSIEKFNVVLDVAKDNKVNVTEEITVNWYEIGHHGIYRFIPTWLEYTDKNGKKTKRKSNITNISVVGEKYTVDNVGKDKKRIKIGSSSTYVPIGYYKYIVKYTYDMGKDPFTGFDEFIFHAYGDYWGTTIKNATMQINMPKAIDSNKVTFWSDKYRKNNITSLVDYTVKGNSIYAKLSSLYNLKNSLTVDIELPEGYFVGGSNNYGMISFLIAIIVIFGSFIMFLTWKKVGKDYDKVSQTVEFYPPDELDAAQIGYVYGKQTSKRLTIALIVQLASKGYIKIESDKSSLKIINLYPDVSSNIKGLQKEIDNDRDKKLSELTQTEAIVYKKLFPTGEINNDLMMDSKFYEVFEQVENSLENTLKDKINDAKAIKAKVISWIWSIISLVITLVSFYIIEDLSPKWNFLYSWSFVASIISFVFAFIMGRKTTYGEQITARVLGFRDYLETAEKQQIDLMVEKDPNYFYNILPYTYALEVSKKWIKKFEKIPEPQYDMGNFDYCDIREWDRINDSIHYPVSSSSGGCGSSSCGGGCSSCGGGCSSCGGGGSW